MTFHGIPTTFHSVPQLSCHFYNLFQQKDDWYPEDTEQNSHISPSENGWTDNRLCMKWMHDCFEPETKHYLRGDYRMLIVDRHASHVSTEFI